MSGNILLYGAYGYTARLILEEAGRQGAKLILGGRDEARLRVLAEEHGLEYRVFSLDDAVAIDRGLDGVDVLLNCAGPFVATCDPLSEACLRNHCHYLDITGEIEVFERMAARDAEAKSAGVMLMPGCGFDVVPTDCLAAYLKAKMPDAERLALGFQGLSEVSQGTARTAIEGAHMGGMIRRGGRLESVPVAHDIRRIDFGRGEVTAATIPWGDVATAWYTTGIPDIQVYVAMPAGVARAMRWSGLVRGVMRSRWVKALLHRVVSARPPGPDADARRRGRGYVWGEACSGDGRCIQARLRTPNPYSLTALSALAIARRGADGDAPAGYQTPAKAYGADFILQFEGVEREDVT